MMTILTILAGEISAQCTIDIHSHSVYPYYVEALTKHNATLNEGFPIPKWDKNSHHEFIKEAGISKSILSMTAPQPYFGNSDECKKIIRGYNEFNAKIKKENPEAFGFCASLPLPDVDAAIEEAIYALDSLNADGIRLATNSMGQYLGDEELDWKLINNTKNIKISIMIRMKLLLTLIVLCATCTITFAQEQHAAERGDKKNNKPTLIFPAKNIAPASNNTGKVYISILKAKGNTMIAHFHFTPGSRNFWHYHPGVEQTLLVLDGEGYYQEEGSPKRLIKKGDVIVSPANVSHWNGGTENSSLVCMTVTEHSAEGHVVQQRAVTEEEYRK